MYVEHIEFTDKGTGNYVFQGYAVYQGLGRGLRAAVTAESLLENEERFVRKFRQWFRDACESGMPLLESGFVYIAPTEAELEQYVWADEIITLEALPG